jgi:hypothetical protein
MMHKLYGIVAIVIAGLWWSCIAQEGDVDHLVWSAPITDVNGDGVTDHLVCSSYCESYPELRVHRDMVVCLDGKTGAVLDTQTRSLLAGLSGMITGVGSARIVPDPRQETALLLAVHSKCLPDAEEPLFEETLAFFELPSLAFYKRIDCGAKNPNLLVGAMGGAESCPGLPPNRLLVVSNEMMIVSLSSMSVVSRSKRPPDDAWFASTLDADGDGVADACREEGGRWLVIQSGGTRRELARSSWFGSREWGTTVMLGVGDGSAGSVVCQMQVDENVPVLRIAKMSALGSMDGQPITIHMR